MRYSEIAALPGTPDEAKNTLLDIVAVYLGRNETEIPLRVVLKTLNRQNFDIDRRLLIDLIKNEPVIKRISGDTIYLASKSDDAFTSKDETEKSKEKVKKMAKKTIKKEVGK